MLVQENISLLPYNTFSVEANARYFCAVETVEDLQSIIHEPFFLSYPTLMLGGGSNLLFTKNWDGLVAKINLMGIEVLRKNEEHVWVKSGAGENWNSFVQWCIQKNYAGLENLSLIPGNVGASPMQNIGAYGVEIKDCFDSLEAVDLKTGDVITFNSSECQFGYRESVFKRALKGQYAITSVTFKLNLKPEYKIGYGAIEQELERMKVQELSIQAISKAVINIRQSKLPDPKILGNAGSFFKNPSISEAKFKALHHQYPEIPNYPSSNGQVKLAAGWLIEQCGWKGKRINTCGVHEKQALVIVNYGGANGNEIYNLSSEVLSAVKQKFDVTLEREVNII
jgi:UDP-N-acetylmuramate dehydrogenase